MTDFVFVQIVEKIRKRLAIVNGIAVCLFFGQLNVVQDGLVVTLK
jgi:hypothetical protein